MTIAQALAERRPKLTPLDIGTAFFLAVAGVLFAVTAFGLWSGRTFGVAFRSRLVARRNEEPALYWLSLAIFVGAALFLVFVAINVRLRS